ncbi:MAG: WXG100 family type VII secretion target [Actinoplanes sp.]
MSNSYKFNFTIADETLDHMDRVNTDLGSALEELERNSEAHLAEWTGGAQGAYKVAKAEWTAGMQEMTAALQSGRVSLFNISDGYGSAEQRATTIWQNTYTGR